MGGCLRPHDSLWDGAHDARLTGDVVDEILGGKVDRADWSVAPDDHRTGARPRHKPSLPYTDSCCTSYEVQVQSPKSNSDLCRVDRDLCFMKFYSPATVRSASEVKVLKGLSDGSLLCVPIVQL